MIIATVQDKAQGKSKQTQLSFDSGSETEDEDDEIQIIEQETAIGWAYVGSHNFTPSAWGNLSGSSFNPILNVRPTHLAYFFLSCP
jgi:tyrosyl-DNA phosphodiesterase 1